MAFIRAQRYITALILASFICCLVLGISFITNADFGAIWLEKKQHLGKDGNAKSKTDIPTWKETNDVHGDADHRKDGDDSHKMDIDADRSVFLTKYNIAHSQTAERVSYDVHAFYYPWYGNPKFDGEYLHWNHEYMPHWDRVENAKWPKGQHKPPDDIGSNYFPELGTYSSRDPDVLNDHMQQISSAGVGVLAVSWYPPEQADGQGKQWDDLMVPIMDAADKRGIKVCFHIEPYRERNQRNLRDNIQYIIDKYGKHPAFYRRFFHGKELPLYYIYDSYLVSKKAWAEIFQSDGAYTVRDTPLDGIFIGLVVQRKHQAELKSAGFDGMYTYFASDGFSYGSTSNNWPALASFAKAAGMLFIPSVGPGYIDEQVRPWNGKNTKDRENGGYYEQSFQIALRTEPDLLSITSFNEWHEGTQIEKAVPKKTSKIKYLDYSPKDSNYYLLLTKKWVFEFMKRKHG